MGTEMLAAKTTLAMLGGAVSAWNSMSYGEGFLFSLWILGMYYLKLKMDKRFGVDLIGGVSSLFLVDNTVLLESNELITEVGEANNINSTNFSANFGMGLNYKFSPKIQINVEPVFKYQLNTFSNVSGNFRPYSIGVYSGFSFRF